MTNIYEEQAEAMDDELEPVNTYDSEPVCPECGTIITIHQGHCMTCPACGWSLCGL